MTETTKTPHLREDVDRQTTSKPEMSPFTLEHGWLPMVINLLNKVACFIRRISLSSGSTGKGARVQCPLSPVKIVHKRVVSKRRTYRFMFPGLPAPPPPQVSGSATGLLQTFDKYTQVLLTLLFTILRSLEVSKSEVPALLRKQIKSNNTVTIHVFFKGSINNKWVPSCYHFYFILAGYHNLIN